MSGKTLMAGLIGAIVLGASAMTAQAAPAPMGDMGVRSGKSTLVEKTHYRRHHHHWRHHHWRHHHWRHHRHHHRHHR